MRQPWLCTQCIDSAKCKNKTQWSHRWEAQTLPKIKSPKNMSLVDVGNKCSGLEVLHQTKPKLKCIIRACLWWYTWILENWSRRMTGLQLTEHNLRDKHKPCHTRKKYRDKMSLEDSMQGNGSQLHPVNSSGYSLQHRYQQQPALTLEITGHDPDVRLIHMARTLVHQIHKSNIYRNAWLASDHGSVTYSLEDIRRVCKPDVFLSFFICSV